MNLGRHKRNTPTADDLGDPPRWLTDAQAAAWREFAGELPWLNRSHRAIVEIACVVRARLQGGEEVGTKAMALLRLCLSSMGATPVDASKVVWPADEEPDDLLD